MPVPQSSDVSSAIGSSQYEHTYQSDQRRAADKFRKEAEAAQFNALRDAYSVLYEAERAGEPDAVFAVQERIDRIFKPEPPLHVAETVRDLFKGTTFPGVVDAEGNVKALGRAIGNVIRPPKRPVHLITERPIPIPGTAAPAKRRRLPRVQEAIPVPAFIPYRPDRKPKTVIIPKPKARRVPRVNALEEYFEPSLFEEPGTEVKSASELLPFSVYRREYLQGVGNATKHSLIDRLVRLGYDPNDSQQQTVGKLKELLIRSTYALTHQPARLERKAAEGEPHATAEQAIQAAYNRYPEVSTPFATREAAERVLARFKDDLPMLVQDDFLVRPSGRLWLIARRAAAREGHGLRVRKIYRGRGMSKAAKKNRMAVLSGERGAGNNNPRLKRAMKQIRL